MTDRVIAGQPIAQDAQLVAQDALRHWQAMREGGDLQFAPVPPAAPKPPPGWLTTLEKWLEHVFAPLGRALGLSWPVLEKLLLGAALLLLLALAWRLLAPWLRSRPWRHLRPAAESEAEWAPSEGEAWALLEDADRLAAEGKFDEAAHLLLRRSLQQITAARPALLHPATTAREIATLPTLPERARGAFALIAARVEQSHFALRPLLAADWDAARRAYADFALQRLDATGGAPA